MTTKLVTRSLCPKDSSSKCVKVSQQNHQYIVIFNHFYSLLERYQDRRKRQDEIRAAEQKAAAEKAAAEKGSTGKRRPGSRRRADKAEKDALEVKDAPVSAKAQRRRQSRSKPEKQPEK